MTRKSTKLTAKGQQTRQRIVAAASDLIDARGIAKTTLEDVRAEAKVSSSQIYHYFADKQSLILAVIEYQDSDGGHLDTMFPVFDSLAAVRAWGAVLVDRQREAQASSGCAIAAMGSAVAADGEGLDRIAATFRRGEDRLCACYRAMQDNGELGVDVDPGALATATLATVIGGLFLTQVNRDTRPLAVAIDTVLSCLPGQGSAMPTGARAD